MKQPQLASRRTTDSISSPRHSASSARREHRLIGVFAVGLAVCLVAGCGKKEELEQANESAEVVPRAQAEAASVESDEFGAVEVDEGEAEASEAANAEPGTGSNNVEQAALEEGVPRAWDAREIQAIRARMGIAPPAPFDLSGTFRRADVREYYGYRGALLAAPLVGTPPSPEHNAIRYATETGYGFGLEVWTFPTVSQGQAFYNELSSSLFVTEPFRRPGVDATISHFAGISQLLAYREASPTVVSITCQSDSCDPGQMARLLSRVLRRL